MNNSERIERRSPVLFGAVMLGAALLEAFLLAANVTLYCDDYLYATFFRDGPAGFWALTKWHYLSFNGRAFVHFVVELVLLFGTKLFAVLYPAMLACVFLLGVRLQCGRIDRGRLLTAAGFAALAVSALPTDYLRTSLLWISACFNYLFPICFLMIVLWVYLRDTAENRLRPLSCVLIFLAGATTEQSGLAAIVVLGGWGLWCLRRRKIGARVFLIPLLLLCAGYASVVFAPGTWVRVGHETSGGILTFLQAGVLRRRFELSMRFMTGVDGLPALFTVFAALSSTHALLTKKNAAALAPGYAAAAAYLLLLHNQHGTLASLLAVVWFLYVALVWLRREDTALRGLLLLGMLAAQLVMICNTSAQHRTAVPAILLLLTVCAALLAECLEKIELRTGEAALVSCAVYFFACFLPVCSGYIYNTGVTAKNEAAFRDTPAEGLVTIDLDYLDPYRYEMYFESYEYLKNAEKCYRLENRRFTYSSGKTRLAGMRSGKEYGLPVIYGEDGQPFFAVTNVAAYAGAKSDWDFAAHGIVVKTAEKTWLLSPDEQSCRLWDQTSETALSDPSHMTIKKPWYTYYISGADCRQIFGVDYRYDSAENVYVFSTAK